MPVFLVYFALLAVAFFFLIVRPQRRQLAARRALVQAVEVGDEIITAGGIYAVVVSIEDETMQVEIAPGVQMTLAREAVARRREDPVPAADDTDAALSDSTAADDVDPED
jgi:preprotein translocase subunit YajC